MMSACSKVAAALGGAQRPPRPRGGKWPGALAQPGASLSLRELAARFNGKGRWRERLPTILDALVALGRARPQGPDRWIDAPQR